MYVTEGGNRLAYLQSVLCANATEPGQDFTRFSTPRSTSEKGMASLVNTLRAADEIVLYLAREIFVAFFHPLPRIVLLGLLFIR
jgi:hypothetical protein